MNVLAANKVGHWQTDCVIFKYFFASIPLFCVLMSQTHYFTQNFIEFFASQTNEMCDLREMTPKHDAEVKHQSCL